MVLPIEQRDVRYRPEIDQHSLYRDQFAELDAHNSLYRRQMLSDGEGAGHVVVQHIAGQWVEQPFAVPMAEPQPVGLMVGLRCAAPTVLRFEAPCTVGVPTIAVIVPTLVFPAGVAGVGAAAASTYYYSTTLLPTGTLLPTLVVFSISW